MDFAKVQHQQRLLKRKTDSFTDVETRNKRILFLFFYYSYIIIHILFILFFIIHRFIIHRLLFIYFLLQLRLYNNFGIFKL